MSELLPIWSCTKPSIAPVASETPFSLLPIILTPSSTQLHFVIVAILGSSASVSPTNHLPPSPGHNHSNTSVKPVIPRYSSSKSGSSTLNRKASCYRFCPRLTKPKPWFISKQKGKCPKFPSISHRTLSGVYQQILHPTYHILRSQGCVSIAIWNATHRANHSCLLLFSLLLTLFHNCHWSKGKYKAATDANHDRHPRQAKRCSTN